MQAAEAKHKDAMEAVKEFNEARDKEKEPSGPQNGSQESLAGRSQVCVRP
jgi:hypothetical protein